MIAEYDAASTLQRRYVHGAGADAPILWYEGAGTTDKRYLMADERGSITSVTNGSGAALGINRYDEYGNYGARNYGAKNYGASLLNKNYGASLLNTLIHSFQRAFVTCL
jgi:hypothetical protein